MASLKMVLQLMVLLFAIVSTDILGAAQGMEKEQEIPNAYEEGNTHQACINEQGIEAPRPFFCCCRQGKLICPCQPPF